MAAPPSPASSLQIPSGSTTSAGSSGGATASSKRKRRLHDLSTDEVVILPRNNVASHSRICSVAAASEVRSSELVRLLYARCEFRVVQFVGAELIFVNEASGDKVQF